MKTGILTFHFVENYGGVLQAYALQSFLAKHGFDTEIIDYRPRALTQVYRLFDDYFRNAFRERNYSLALKLSVVYLLTMPQKIRKKYHFNRFIRHRLNLSCPKVTDLEGARNSASHYDMYVCGSDQIWNSDITGGLDPVYFASFAPKEAIKISYAASIGKKELTQSEIAQMSCYLDDFQQITVREEEAKELLKPIGKSISVVCDPVFLLDTNHWKGLFGRLAPRKKKYLLIYTLEHHTLIDETAKALADEHHLEIVKITLYKELGKCIGKQISGISPEKFLSLIFYADYVVTNSFHAAAFSILFHKNLYVVHHSVRGGRTRNLLHHFNLEHCEVADHMQSLKQIDWELVDRQINADQKMAINLLPPG